MNPLFDSHVSVDDVEVVHWNPRQPWGTGPLTSRVPRRHRVGNFGDLIGPYLVQALRRQLGGAGALESRRWPGTGRGVRRLLTVGSILHFARTSDVVWGSGRNGKVPDSLSRFESLDVRAVRGPLTQRFLQQRGVACPSVFGDPALLLPEVYTPRELPRRDVVHVPNLHDLGRLPARPSQIPVLSPLSDLEYIVDVIASSRMVVGSSLHGIVVAEAYGVPARIVTSASEPEFKYVDYFEGTGRRLERAGSVDEAADMGGAARPSVDRAGLRNAFPSDLWPTPQRAP